MAKFINGRWVTDAELYPEQFEDLPDEALPKERKRSVRLDDIGEDGERRGKSQEKADCERGEVKKNNPSLASILEGTAPAWKNRDAVKDTVNPHENASEDETVEKIYSKKRKETAKAYAMKTVASSTVTERKLRDKLKLWEYTEEDIEAGFKVLHPAEAEASGELDDDALDSVAGGTTYNKRGYAVVTMNVKCLAPGQPYAESPFPAHPHTLDGKRCGTCIHMVTMDGMEVCPLTIEPAIANRK